MKKKVLLGAFAALCLGVGITAAVKASQMSKQASAMMLDQVEALAESELERCPYASMQYCSSSWVMSIGCQPRATGASCTESYLNNCPC